MKNDLNKVKAVLLGFFLKNIYFCPFIFLFQHTHSFIRLDELNIRALLFAFSLSPFHGKRLLFINTSIYFVDSRLFPLLVFSAHNPLFVILLFLLFVTPLCGTRLLAMQFLFLGKSFNYSSIRQIDTHSINKHKRCLFI